MSSPGEMIPTPRLGLVFLSVITCPKSAVTALRLAGFIPMLELACTNLLPASSASNHSQSPSPPEPMSRPLLSVTPQGLSSFGAATSDSRGTCCLVGAGCLSSWTLLTAFSGKLRQNSPFMGQGRLGDLPDHVRVWLRGRAWSQTGNMISTTVILMPIKLL